MQQVAAFQESICRKADYDALAKRQIDEIWSSVSMKDDDLTKLVDIYAGDHLLEEESAKPLDLDALQKELQKENVDSNNLDEQGLARLSRDVIGVSIEDARGASPHKPAIKASKRGEAKVVKAADGNSLRREKWVLERPKPVDVDDALSGIWVHSNAPALGTNETESAAAIRARLSGRCRADRDEACENCYSPHVSTLCPFSLTARAAAVETGVELVLAPTNGEALHWVLPRHARPPWRLPQHAPLV